MSQVAETRRLALDRKQFGIAIRYSKLMVDIIGAFGM